MNIKAAIFSFISGLLGSMGFGGGAVLIILLTGVMSMDQKEAQGVNLFFFVITCIPAIICNIYKGMIDSVSLRQFLKRAIPGLLIGLIVLPFIKAKLLRKFFGGALLLLGLKNLFQKSAKAPPES